MCQLWDNVSGHLSRIRIVIEAFLCASSFLHQVLIILYPVVVLSCSCYCAESLKWYILVRTINECRWESFSTLLLVMFYLFRRHMLNMRFTLMEGQICTCLTSRRVAEMTSNEAPLKDKFSYCRKKSALFGRYKVMACSAVDARLHMTPLLEPQNKAQKYCHFDAVDRSRLHTYWGLHIKSY